VVVPHLVGGRPVDSMILRFAPLWLVLVLGSVLPSSALAVDLADGQSLDAVLAEARRALEIAKLELRLYTQVEYPRERRCLDAQIEILAAEVDALTERLREYEKFHRSRTSRPFLTSIQETKLSLLAAELRLKDAREERNTLHRFHPDRSRLFELKVESARARVVALDQLWNGP